MDQASPSTPARGSGIPRLSRLPVPQALSPFATLKPSPSREKLATDRGLISRLRNAPSQDNLRSSTASRQNIAQKPRDIQTLEVRGKASSGRPAVKEAQDDHVFKKPFARPPSRQNVDSRPQSRQSSDLPSPLERSESADGKHDDELELGTGISTPLQRKSRPSLSDRTIETLAQIPPSPSPRRRKSSFYVAESPKRPGSAMSRGSRPSSSVGNHGTPNNTDSGSSFGTRSVAQPTTKGGMSKVRQGGIDGSTVKSKNPTKAIGVLGGVRNTSTVERIDGGIRATSSSKPGVPSVTSGAQTYSGRSAKPGASLQDSFQTSVSCTPSRPSTTRRVSNDVRGTSTSSSTPLRPTAARVPTNGQSQSSSVSRKTATTPKSETRKASPSSSTLRETIAKAKAARKSSGTQRIPRDPKLESNAPEAFDFDMPSDPFNQNQDPTGNKGLFRKRVEAARVDGKLNIAAMGLNEIPEAVLKMYDLESTDTTNGAWYESVDLVKFIAADNEIERLSEEVFPDIAPEDLLDQEDTKGSQFGGLEILDLHGNLLCAVPSGLKRLERLTTLNLSNNKLDMTVFNTIVQIPSLKQLKLCSNRLEGNVPDSIGGLATLEILDLHENIITHLPDEVHNLRLLSVLNVSSNKLSSIPLSHLGNLTELLASKNKLSGSLFPSGVSSMQNLRTLDVMGNSITELSGGVDLGLPALKLLVITANRVTHLPDVSTWQELLTISAEDNKINAFPAGLVSLKNIRHLDFTGNDLKVLDEHLADMESLQVLSISNNPLREKKFLSMTTDDIKRDLRARLTPKEEASDIHDGAELLSNLEVESTVNGTGTPVKNGVLDLANKQLLTLSSTQLSKIAAQCSVNNLEIHHNSLSSFPLEVSIFSGSLISLNLAHNDLRSETLFSKDLVLPALRSLNISSNSLKSLEPILEHLQSPVLDIINVSCNRITVFPSLRDYFPALQTVLASDNIIQELTVEAVRGLHICDVSRNDIAHLPPRLGLLGNDGGLRRLEVQGNKFRVPRWNIVDKGTDVLLSWLKDKIPVDEAEDDVD